VYIGVYVPRCISRWVWQVEVDFARHHDRQPHPDPGNEELIEKVRQGQRGRGWYSFGMPGGGVPWVCPGRLTVHNVSSATVVYQDAGTFTAHCTDKDTHMGM